jgi:hypothetical protein
MQLKGGKPVTLTRGQTFFEGPNGHCQLNQFQSALG